MLPPTATTWLFHHALDLLSHTAGHKQEELISRGRRRRVETVVDEDWKEYWIIWWHRGDLIYSNTWLQKHRFCCDSHTPALVLFRAKNTHLECHFKCIVLTRDALKESILKQAEQSSEFFVIVKTSFKHLNWAFSSKAHLRQHGTNTAGMRDLLYIPLGYLS